MPDRAFELALLERAATRAQWPVTPDLRDRVMTSLNALPQRRSDFSTPRRRLAWRPALALAIVAVAAVALAVSLAIPSSRGAIADFFGVEGSKIEVLPTPAPGVTPTPLPTPRDIASGLTPVALSQAESALGFPIALPAGEQPDSAFIIRYADNPVAILRYANFDLWETHLPAYASFGKEVPATGRIDDLLVAGHPAHWVSGGPHFAFYSLPDGSRLQSSDRQVTKDTLIWKDGDIFYRLETDLSRDQAVAIAESLR